MNVQMSILSEPCNVSVINANNQRDDFVCISLDKCMDLLESEVWNDYNTRYIRITGRDYDISHASAFMVQQMLMEFVGDIQYINSGLLHFTNYIH